MNKIERAEKVFFSVREKLYKEKPKNNLVINLLYKHPWKFYRLNGVKGSMRLLKEEANNIIKGCKK